MADFRKFGNLSTSGWNAATLTQTVNVGSNAHLGLWGGGPKGEDLVVQAADPSICVVHEEPRPKSVANMRHFLITALQAGTTEIRATLPGSGAAYAMPATVKVGGTSKVRLVFFPGERTQGSTTMGTIYVIGGHGETMKAAGGPPVGRADRGGHTVDPTPAGLYVLGPQIKVIAPSWPTSVIPWDAALRINSANEVEYEASKGKWIVATGPSGEVTKAQMTFHQRSHLKPKLKDVIPEVRGYFINPKTGKLWNATWVWNDFGRWGWNLRKGGARTAYFIHTTPDDEHATDQGKSVFLANSHGCVHLVPNERDRFMKAGYLKEGVSFEVRPYTEIGPP